MCGFKRCYIIFVDCGDCVKYSRIFSLGVDGDTGCIGGVVLLFNSFSICNNTYSRGFWFYRQYCWSAIEKKMDNVIYRFLRWLSNDALTL